MHTTTAMTSREEQRATTAGPADPAPGRAAGGAPAGAGAGGGKGPVLAIVFGFLGLSVGVHAVAVTWAFRAPQELVRADYYEAGERHDAELALRAAAAGVGPLFRRGPAGEVIVALPDASAAAARAKATLRWQRPAAAAADLTLELAPDGAAVSGGRWRANGPTALLPGAWNVRLEVAATPPLAVEVAVHVGADGSIAVRAPSSAAKAAGVAGGAAAAGGGGR